MFAERVSQLFKDIAALMDTYGGAYLKGAGSTLLLAIIATFIGCVIGFVCGILQTIPLNPGDGPVKRVLLGVVRVIIRIYVEVFRGTPMILQAVFIYYGLPYFSGNRLQFTSIWYRPSVVPPWRSFWNPVSREKYITSQHFWASVRAQLTLILHLIPSRILSTEESLIRIIHRHATLIRALLYPVSLRSPLRWVSQHSSPIRDLRSSRQSESVRISWISTSPIR